MISLLIKIIFTIVLHFAFFVCYPETGKYGDWYLWGSIMIWSFFFMSMWGNLKFLKLLTFPVASFLNTGLYLAMFFLIALTMPQRDGRSVFKKLNSGKFPTRTDIETGKIKYLNGFLAEKPKEKVNKTVEDVKNSIDKAKKAASALGKGE